MEPPSVTGDRVGLVTGSGLGDIVPLLGRPERVHVDVVGPDGRTVQVAALEIDGAVVLPRHGVGESVPAHLLDHHANIRALCAAGCGRVIALASVGSLRTDWPAGTVVVPDDFIALNPSPTFFDDTRGHRVPGFDDEWRRSVITAWREATATPVHDGGVYAQTTGPRLETPAEVRMLASWADLVGMTVASEAALAGEAGLPYAALCKVDNLANGIGSTPLSMDEYKANTAATREQLLTDVAALLGNLAAP